MTNSSFSSLTTNVRRLLVICGTALILCGCVFILYFASFVFQIVNQPEDVKIVEYTFNILGKSPPQPSISGTFAHPSDPSQSVAFQMTVSDDIKTFAFFILGIMGLGVLVGIARTLISSGTALVKLAFTQKSESPPPK